MGSLVVLLLILGSTVAIFAIFTGGFDVQSGKFWIAFGAILFAELMFFGLPLAWSVKVNVNGQTNDNLITSSDVTKASSFPFQFAAIPITGLYLLSVVVLGLISFTPISVTVIGVLQIAAFVSFAVLFVSYLSANRAISQADVLDRSAMRGYDEARMRVDRIGIAAGTVPEENRSHFESVVEGLKDKVVCMAADVPSSLMSQGGDWNEEVLIHKLRALEARVARYAQNSPSSEDLISFESEVNELSRLIDMRETSIRFAR